MSDIFGFKGSGTNTEVVVPSAGVVVDLGGELSLVQQATVQYQRGVNPVYELGSETVYLSITPGTGTLQLSRVVGESSALSPYSSEGNECSPVDIILTNGEATCAGKFGTVTCSGALLQNVGVTAQAGQHMVTDSASYIFTTLEL